MNKLMKELYEILYTDQESSIHNKLDEINKKYILVDKEKLMEMITVEEKPDTVISGMNLLIAKLRISTQMVLPKDAPPKAYGPVEDLEKHLRETLVRFLSRLDE